MKIANLSYFLAGLLAFGSTLSASAISITGADNGTVTQLPGSPTDFLFFGNGSGTATSVLTDFTVNTLGSNMYGGDGGYSTINSPLGVSTLTGLAYKYADSETPLNIATFTLGTSPTFNYANFDVFVLYSNADVGGPNTRIDRVYLGAGADAVGGTGTVVSVSDTNSSTSAARVVEYHVTGLSSGDSFTIGSSSPSNPTSIGAVSFESNAVPEPSTYAMMIAGVALLGFCFRFRAKSQLS